MSSTRTTPTTEVVFVLDDLPDLNTLLAGLPVGREVHVLDANGDALAQMAGILAGRSGLDAIHLMSHGAPGALHLGSLTLDGGTLAAQAETLAKIGLALGEHGDFLLYGCDVGAGDAGAAFLHTLAEMTGADVSASTDATGAAEKAGNWLLEAGTGPVDAAILAVDGYAGILGADSSIPAGLASAPYTWNPGTGDITFATHANGEIATTDGRSALYNGGSADRYTISGVADGTTLHVYMGNSSTLDDFVQIGRPTGPGTAEVVIQDDDGGDGERNYDAYLSWTYQTGDQILCYPLTKGHVGTYSLYLSSGTLTPLDPPGFSDALGVIATYDDTAATDTFDATTGITLTSATSDVTFSVDAANGSSAASRIGTYGTLAVASNGAVTYTPNASAINALAGGANVTDTFTVNVSDGIMKGSKTLTVNLTGSNEAPTITSNGADASAQVDVSENQTAVTTVAATDVDTGTTLTYSISGGADQAKFAINASTGVLTFASAPNYESPTDANTDNDYTVEVTASDGTLTDTQAITVRVLNVLEAPTLGGLDPAGCALGATPVVLDSDLTIGDHDLDALNSGNGDYRGAQLQLKRQGGANAEDDFGFGAAVTVAGANLSLDGGDTVIASFTEVAGLLTVNFASAGAIARNQAEALMEAITYRNTGTTTGDVTLEWKLYDDGAGSTGLSVTATQTMTLSNAVPVISSNGGGATAAINVAENSTAVTTVVAADDDTGAGQTLTYSISGGGDQAKFAINASTGVLTFVAAPDFEAPADAGDTAGNNTYVVEVTASDGNGGTDSQAITVTVTDVNENAGGGGTPTPPPSSGIFDGVPTNTTSTTNGGTTTTTTTIPVIDDTRPEDSSTTNNDLADIPLVTGTGGGTLLEISAPVGLGLTSDNISGSGMGLRDTLIAASNPKIVNTDVFAGVLARGIDAYVPTVRDEAQVVVRSLSFNVGEKFDASKPIVVTGAVGTGEKSADNPLRQEALVLDTRGLPTGSTLQLNKVEFAIVVGEVRLTGGEGANFIVGDDYRQTMDMGDGDDVMLAGGGNDELWGGTGNDVLGGGDGDDLIDGGAGTDTATYTDAGAGVRIDLKLLGKAQNTGGGGLDTLRNIQNLTGSDHDDTLLGSRGKVANTLQGGDGNDTLNGLGGVDTVSYADATAGVTVSLGLRTAQETGGAGTDTLLKMENLAGSAHADQLTGSRGKNVLTGGEGADVLTGGRGRDTFQYDALAEGGDTITDFRSGQDKLAFSGEAFGGLSSGKLGAGLFGTGASAQTAEQRFVFDSATGNLYYDADGSGGETALLIGTLNGVASLSVKDFVIL